MQTADHTKADGLRKGSHIAVQNTVNIEMLDVKPEETSTGK